MTRLNRRHFLELAGLGAVAVAGGGTVAGCGDAKTSNGPGTTGQDQLRKLLPAYVASDVIKPDIPSVPGANGFASTPVFLTYPAGPVTTVPAVPGKGGTYTSITPLWGAIPSSSNNTYYDTVNAALGATIKIQPSDGNNYDKILPTLFAGDKLPDWLMIPSWNMSNLGFSDAVTKFADLGPYLSGDAVKAYPNLAAIPTSAWQCCIWNGKLYGLPTYYTSATSGGAFFYRKDIFAKEGIDAGAIRTPTDLEGVAKQLTDPRAGRWGFGDLGDYLGLIFKYPGDPNKWALDASGKLVHRWEMPQYLDGLSWFAKQAKAGLVHPDALAGKKEDGNQRFYSGKEVIQAGGTGAWAGADTQAGKAQNPGFERQAFHPLSVDGKPEVQMNPSAGMYSFVNGKLSADQIREVLAIANYLAAPYGSAEWLTVNFGKPGVDYTMSAGNPKLTEKGSKEVAQTYQFLVTPLSPVPVVPGEEQVAKDYAAWEADEVKYAVKPLFFGMNITEPAQYAKLSQPMADIEKDVRYGRKPVSAFQDALKTWKAQGGDQLRAFYEDVRAKYGTGQ